MLLSFLSGPFLKTLLISLILLFFKLQVHLLTALVDDLTAEASAPVDRLAGAALAVSKAELGERIQQQSNFEMQADELKASVARVRTHASKAVENSRHTSKVRHVRVTGDFIDRLTPQVIAAARALAGEKNLHESSRNAVLLFLLHGEVIFKRRDGNFALKRGQSLIQQNFQISSCECSA